MEFLSTRKGHPENIWSSSIYSSIHPYPTYHISYIIKSLSQLISNYIYIYHYGGFTATGSFPKGNQGCQGADWSEPLLQSHQGSKGWVIRVLIACHACVERYIFRWGDQGEGLHVMLIFFSSFLPIPVCSQDPYTLSDKQLSYLDVAIHFRERAGFLVGSISPWEFVSFLLS